MPTEIMDFNVIHMGSEISSLVRVGCSVDAVKMRFKEVALMVEHCSGPGLVISYGDVDKLVNEDSSCIVGELTNLLNLFGAKVWLIGASASFETFLKFSNRFPFVVKDWDLQLLPITSLRPSSEEPIPKSTLMESFVPLGGFFPSSCDLTSSFVGLNQLPTRCHLCNEKCEQEIYAINKRGFTNSVFQQLSSSAPSRLQMNEWRTKSPLEIVKTDECITMNAKAKMMQMKWDNICQHLHHTSQSTREDIYSSSSRVSTDNPQSGISTELATKFLSPKHGKILKSNHIDLNELTPLPLSNSSSEDRHTSPCSSTYVSDFDHGDFKKLYNMLIQTMSWQEEAVSAITQAIARCKTRNQKDFGMYIRGDIWFFFLGSDNFSKRKIAIALVELLYGSRGNFIHVDLNSHDQDSIKFRRKNVIDYLAWELGKKPFSVVFLENIEKSDLVVQNSLLQAIRSGKFPDLHGREVGISNTIFVLTSKLRLGDEWIDFFEESILRANKKQLQMIINCGNEPFPVIYNRRKLMGISEIVKRAHKDPILDLDLNFPPGDNTEFHFEENSKVWLENFLDLVDETVIFKPFDFEKFTDKIVKEIDDCFQSIIGSDCVLEVDSLAMEQILTYTYLSEGNEVQDWVKNVLSRGFLDAQKNHNFRSSGILKLTTREGDDLVEETSGFHLPSRIIVEQGPES